MGALIKYDSGRRVHLKEAVRYVDSKRHGRVLIDPFPSGFTAEGAKTFEIRLGCLEERFKFEKGVVVATDENLGRLSTGFHGLNLDGWLGDGGTTQHIEGHGMLDFSLPGYKG